MEGDSYLLLMLRAAGLGPFLLLAAFVFLAACASTGGSRDLSRPAPDGAERIVFWTKRSSERIDVIYRQGGHYNPEAFAKIDHMFRDRHNGDEYAIDPNLIELIAGLRDRMVMAPDTPIELLSGYRSPETNANLSRTNKYVAKQSYHMRGQAADIRIPDMNSHALELVAKTLQRGGVALYPDSGHVHVDTGPTRGWEVVPGYEEGLERREIKAVEAAKASKNAPPMLTPPPAPPPVISSVPPKTLLHGKITVTPAPAPLSPTARSLRAHPVYSPAHKPKHGAKPVIRKKPVKKKKPVAKPVVKKPSTPAPAAPPAPAPAAAPEPVLIPAPAPEAAPAPVPPEASPEAPASQETTPQAPTNTPPVDTSPESAPAQTQP